MQDRGEEENIGKQRFKGPGRNTGKDIFWIINKGFPHCQYYAGHGAVEWQFEIEGQKVACSRK